MEMTASSENAQVKPTRTGATLLQARFQNKEDSGTSKHPKERTSLKLADVEEVYGQKSLASLKKSKKAQDLTKEK